MAPFVHVIVAVVVVVVVVVVVDIVVVRSLHSVLKAKPVIEIFFPTTFSHRIFFLKFKVIDTFFGSS